MGEKQSDERQQEMARLSAEIEGHRRYLLRYATLHLRDPHAAEDVVQDALAGAYANLGQFAGRAQLRTWLISILRRKIVDHFRARAREPRAAGETDVEELPDEADGEFDASEEWRESPARWGAPEAALQSAQFWRVFEACCKVMPARYAQVFTMREVMELSSAEICAELGMSESNLHVTLFRARLRLRECMTRNWFGDRDA